MPQISTPHRLGYLLSRMPPPLVRDGLRRCSCYRWQGCFVGVLAMNKFDMCEQQQSACAPQVIRGFDEKRNVFFGSPRYTRKPTLAFPSVRARIVAGGHSNRTGRIWGIQRGDPGYLQRRRGEGFLQGHVGVILGVQRGVPVLRSLRANQEVGLDVV